MTTNLEKNLGHSIKTLQQHLDSGAVKEPTEVARLQRTIERLQATQTALEAGRAGKPAELPEGVVFELANVGRQGKQIGKEHWICLPSSMATTHHFWSTFSAAPSCAIRS